LEDNINKPSLQYTDSVQFNAYTSMQNPTVYPRVSSLFAWAPNCQHARSTWVKIQLPYSILQATMIWRQKQSGVTCYGN